MLLDRCWVKSAFQKRPSRCETRKEIGVHDLSQALHHVDHPGAVAAGDAAVEQEHLIILDGGQGVVSGLIHQPGHRFRRHTLRPKGARHHHYVVRLVVQDFLPSYLPGLAPLERQALFAAGEFHQFRHPLAGVAQGGKPVDAEDPGTGRIAGEGIRHPFHTLTQFLNQGGGPVRDVGGLPDVLDVVEDVLQSRGPDGDELRLVVQGLGGGLVDRSAGNGADLAYLLGQDDVRMELPEQILVYPVEGVVVGPGLLDDGVYLDAAQVADLPDAPADHRLARGVIRVVARMRHSHQLVAKPQGIDHFGGAGKQRAYSHSQLLPDHAGQWCRPIITV